ncbi:TonB-dependent receptor [candidate division KSB1 bacterium]|nr:TonB-dependent receptor [candidate division KSB1 bacterium]
MNRCKMWLSLCLLVLVPCLAFAQDGKLRGRITDKDSGEPLIGASVVLDGTTLGASADLNGDYVVLGVPPGVYTVKVSYIGYQALSVSNVRVSANLTTTQDYQLKSSAIEVGAMEVVAERPLVQRNTTNTVRLTTSEDIENLPIRGVQNILALNAGTVQQNGELFVRGSRQREVAYFVDGATATNPQYNDENVAVIQEAIEELQLQTGGFTAEFGGANSGIVKTTVKSGGSKMKVTLDYRTDDFVGSGEEFLGTTSRGFRNGVLTIGGPILGSKLRYFVAGQHNYFRNRTPSFVDAFNVNDFVDPATGKTLGELGGMKDDGLEGRTAGSSLPSNPIAFKKNALPLNSLRDNTAQGTLVYDYSSSLKFRLTGSYNHNQRPLGHGTFRDALNNFFDDQEFRREIKTSLVGLKATHVLSPTTFYEVNLNYSDRAARDFDPQFGDEWEKYTDARAFAAAGNDTSEWRTLFQGPLPYSIIFNFPINAPGTPNNSYARNDQTSVGGSIDFTSQLNKNIELKVGGRLDRWTMRGYSIGNIRNFLEYFYDDQTGAAKRDLNDPIIRRVEATKGTIGNVGFYGYDVDGRTKINSGVYGPRNPLFASGYMQTKWEYRDLILNVGLRYERIDAKVLKPVSAEISPNDKSLYDPTNQTLLESAVTETEAQDFLLPRVNFAFPVTDRTVFYAQYGKYVQMPNLDDLYRGGFRTLSRDVLPETRSLYGFFGQYVGFTAEPEKTEQFELGIRQSLTDNFAFTITTFYKDMSDQLRLDRVYADGTGALADGTPILSGWVNNDFGTAKGLETTLELRRTKRLAAKFSHTLSDARGTGSDSRSTRVAVSDASVAIYPTLIYRLNQNQTHRGSAVLDYRFAQGDGNSILQGIGLNAVLTYSSGHSYTRIQEPNTLGQANAWDVGTDPQSDPRYSNPIEPINSSTTPWNFNLDLNLDKQFYFSKFNVRVYANMLNVLNTRNIINVYATTGTADDDGWLKTPTATQYLAIPYYEDFYRAVNLNNRWAYGNATGNDLYAAPREFRVGLALEFF